MKLWIKSLIAIVLALLVGLFIPLKWNWAILFFDFTSDLAFSIGRYLLFPLVFFSLSIRCFELYKQRQLGKTIRYFTIFIFAMTILFTTLFSPFAFFLKGLPIDSIQQSEALNIPSVKEVLSQIFPENLFSIFLTDGSFLIPLVLFALLLGTNLSFDKIMTRPIAELFDSFSQLFFHMNVFLCEISGIGFFFIFTSLILELRQLGDLSLFFGFLLLLTIISLVLILIIYPLCLFLFTKHRNPYKLLFGMFTPAIAAFISGSIYFSAPLSFYHNEKNLGIKHQLNVVITALTTVFGRACSALITSTSVIFLYRTYYSNITFTKTLTIIFLSFALSFFTGSFHRKSIIASIALIFTVLGTERNEYLNLIKIAPLLYSFSAMLDSITNTVIAYIVSSHIEQNKDIRIHDFV